jgi:tRNA(Ile2) C34 agmatinyltransferase TiaS
MPHRVGLHPGAYARNASQVARSLHEARREAAERLDRQVAKATADDAVVASTRRLIDKRELRGWPAAGRGINGAIAGTVPGHRLFDE